MDSEEKSYWTKRRKVLSNVDSFLRSCDANTASTEMMESCMSEYCVGGIATVGTNTYFSGCSVARCATDSPITTTTIPVGSDVDDSCCL